MPNHIYFSKNFSCGVGFLSFNFTKMAGIPFVIWKKTTITVSILDFFFINKEDKRKSSNIQKRQKPTWPTRLSLNKALAPFPKKISVFTQNSTDCILLRRGNKCTKTNHLPTLPLYSVGKNTPVRTMLLRAKDVPPRPKIQLEISAIVPFTPGLLVSLFLQMDM